MEYKTAKGWLTDSERDWLFELARAVPDDGWIINIGIEFGASLHCLREGSPFARLIGIDLLGDAKLDSPVKGLVVIKGDSTLLGQAWIYADLVFVDGGHDYTTVLADATLWSAVLKPGGVIAFHDCYLSPAAEQVNDAVSVWHRLNIDFEELSIHDSIRTFKRS